MNVADAISRTSTAIPRTELTIKRSSEIHVELLPLSTHHIAFGTTLSPGSLTWGSRLNGTADDLADTLVAYSAYARCASKRVLQQPWPATIGAEDLQGVGSAAKG